MPRTPEGYYTPLPDYLTIRASEIHGLGLFATKPIERGTVLGVTHVRSSFPVEDDEWIRLPLGGFYNHNDTVPNCESREKDGIKSLVAIRDIAAGEEITARYTLYDPTK